MLTKKMVLVAVIAAVVSLFLLTLSVFSRSRLSAEEATSSGISVKAVGNPMVIGIPIRAPAKGLEPNDIEAVEWLAKQWKVVKLGDSFYTCRRNHSSIGICEFKSPTFTIEPHGITQADKLNGIEYRVGVIITALAQRNYSISPQGRGQWSAWNDQPYVTGSDVIRVRGNWQYVIPPDNTWSYKELTLSEIPN